MKRFMALDSWRGICACLVALYHFQSQGHLQYSSVLASAFLFVDFFFVLSGFVIAANYHRRIATGFGIGKFMFLRFARLYPLHLAVLLMLVAIEFVHYIVQDRPVFGEQRQISHLLTHLLLIHSLGIHDSLSWNGPAWSVSVEFFTYLTYAIILRFLPRAFWWILALSLIGLPIIILAFSHRNMDTTFSLGFLRCVTGFFAGVLTYRLWELSTQARALADRRAMWTCMEGVAVAATMLFVGKAQSTSLSVLAPFVFSIVVLVFAYERGAISSLLRTRPLIHLGALSYAIYLGHAFLIERFANVAAFVRARFSQLPFAGDSWPELDIWLRDLYAVVYFALLVAFAYLLFHGIERPAQKWLRARLAPESSLPVGLPTPT